MNQQTIGQRLGGARESIRASLYQASQDTKIRVDFLQCMEEDQFNFVSGHMYVRGMLRSYVRWLGLDEAPILREFDAVYDIQPESTVSAMISRPTNVGPKPRRPQWLLAASGAVAILLVLSLVGLMNPDGNVATPPPNPVDAQAQADAVNPATPGLVAEGPTVPVEGVNVKLDVIGARAWVQVHGDGNEDEPVFEGILENGQSQLFSASQRVKILIGDLGAVKLALNGKDLGTPGESGQVGTREFTPESVTVSGG